MLLVDGTDGVEPVPVLEDREEEVDALPVLLIDGIPLLSDEVVRVMIKVLVLGPIDEVDPWSLLMLPVAEVADEPVTMLEDSVGLEETVIVDTVSGVLTLPVGVLDVYP